MMAILYGLRRSAFIIVVTLGASLGVLSMLLILPHTSVASSTIRGGAGVPNTPTDLGQCDIEFSDVPADSPFHSYIICLACRQVLSGYADGSFGPGNNVTRGQLSKIVSNSVGFDDVPGSQIFEDIPPGSPFYAFINSLATRGFIGGYPCGGAGEPCVQPLQRSYFRPNSPASRGQIAKIVSNTAGFSDAPGAQLYQDVSPGSPFYDWVQRLGRLGVISGYPCGGAGEPCAPPGNRPYFRPSANTTRGQLTKIVGNTFFLDCFDTGAGHVTLAGVSETSFNSVSSVVRFEISDASFTTDPDLARVVSNQVLVDQSLVHVSAQVISVTNVLQEGRNDLVLVGQNPEGEELGLQSTVWAGSQVLNVTVLDENSDPVNGASVTARLADDAEVFATGTTVGGNLSFSNIPDRTIILEASANGNLLHGTLAITGNAGNVNIQLVGFEPASDIDNNDFHLGTAGWNVGSAPVSLIPHTDDEEEEANPTGKSERKGEANAPAEDMDLQLSTADEGPQSISRTFNTEEGTTSVSVRYRFITSEVPGGYFGTQYNDYFNVSIRSQGGGDVSSESNAMNGLGLGAFNAQGATDWREETLSVNEGGDTIQVDVTVGNVADGAYDSSVVIAAVTEKKLKITDVQLNDIDNIPLRFLSASDHTYFSSHTRVHGTIRIEGDPSDSLETLELQVIKDGHIKAKGRLPTALQSQLLRSFGNSGVIEVTTSQFLFALPASDLTDLDLNTEANVHLKIKATSTNGQTATKQAGQVRLLVRYTHGVRYGPRDVAKGGDDWIRPSVRPVIMNFTGIETGDISNMNGGQFPGHSTHDDGTHVDAWVEGYNARDADTADKLIALLNNKTSGPRIILIYVTFDQAPGDPFWQAIKDVVLDDNRRARDVIIPLGGHHSHFHLMVSTQ